MDEYIDWNTDPGVPDKAFFTNNSVIFFLFLCENVL